MQLPELSDSEFAGGAINPDAVTGCYLFSEQSCLRTEISSPGPRLGAFSPTLAGRMGDAGSEGCHSPQPTVTMLPGRAV